MQQQQNLPMSGAQGIKIEYIFSQGNWMKKNSVGSEACVWLKYAFKRSVQSQHQEIWSKGRKNKCPMNIYMYWGILLVH